MCVPEKLESVLRAVSGRGKTLYLYESTQSIKSRGTWQPVRKAMARSWPVDPAPLALCHWTVLFLVPLLLSLSVDQAVSTHVGEFNMLVHILYVRLLRDSVC